MAKYKAIVEIDLKDEDNDPQEVTVIEEGIFQAVTELLEAAGYIVTAFRSSVLFVGETSDDELSE